MHSTTVQTYVECCTLCLITDGCLAASVRQDNNGVMCNLSNSVDTEDDTNATTYKNGEYEGRFNNWKYENYSKLHIENDNRTYWSVQVDLEARI